MRAGILPWNNFRSAAAWGSVIWLLVLLNQWPDPYGDEWARLLLLLAMLVWVPLGLSLLGGLPAVLRYAVFPAACSALASLQFPSGIEAASFALPWLGITMLLFVHGLERLFRAGSRAAPLALASACMFILIGGSSLLADRLGYRPLGFDPAIVLLTAVHFHYAGFVFPILLGLGAAHFPGWEFRWAAVLAIGAVPLTAAGITLTQLHLTYVVEAIAAAVVAGSGWLGAWAYAGALFRRWIPWGVRVCWALLAVCLVFSMTLALGYALRPYVPLEALNIPAMRAWHGTANGLVLAGSGLVGWILQLSGGAKTNF